VKGIRTRLDRVTERLRRRDLVREVVGEEDVVVSGVSQDSREVAPGDLFLAWRGTVADAHEFVVDAAGAGAVAAVVERPVEDARIPQVVVSDGRLAGSLAADAVMASPWAALTTVAITGTNGKTTTALLLRHVLAEAGDEALAPAAVLGTLGVVGPDGSVRPGTEGLTTPGPVAVSGRLRDLADEQVRTVVLEASSHALEQRRLDAIDFDVAVFTNFSRDHLDYHGDPASYREAKLRLADLVATDGTLVWNQDEAAWTTLVERRPGLASVSFGRSPSADLRAEEIELGATGSRFRMSWRDGDGVEVDLPLLASFNVDNALAASAAALALGVPLEKIAGALGTAPQIPGRLERVPAGGLSVLIDFAHTPDALARVLDTVRAVRGLVDGRLVVLFGAGGDRDRGKRAPMAEAVARRADLIVLTSDNPRTEDPEQILDDLEAGLESVAATLDEPPAHARIADREEAIAHALRSARPGDLVLLAGKGHERDQVVGHERRPLDEREVVRRVLAS